MKDIENQDRKYERERLLRDIEVYIDRWDISWNEYCYLKPACEILERYINEFDEV